MHILCLVGGGTGPTPQGQAAPQAPARMPLQPRACTAPAGNLLLQLEVRALLREYMPLASADPELRSSLLDKTERGVSQGQRVAFAPQTPSAMTEMAEHFPRPQTG